MKTFLNLMLFFCVSPILFSQYFQPSSNSSHLPSNFRTTGRIVIGDQLSTNEAFQVYRNTTNTNMSAIVGNASGKWEFSVAGVNGAYAIGAKPGDGIIRKLTNSNMFFVMPNNNMVDPNSDTSTPTSPGVTKIKFMDNYNLNSLVIFNTGKVTMGTELYDNSDYRLYVKNGIKTEKVKVEVASSSGWADYVFKEDYHLIPLKEVKSFINENGHLPNMPSAQEIVNDGGFELKEMNVKLLEKIEELTLYIIQQNEEIGKLKESIEDIKSNSN